VIRVLVALIAVLLPLLSGQAQAQPLPVDQSVEVALTTMQPLNPQPDKTLRLAGRLRNRGEQDVTALQVRLLLSSTPMATRSEIGVVIAGGSDRDGPPTLAVSEPIAVLPPRTSVDWSLKIPLTELPLGIPGVYVIGLEVIGTGADGLVQRFGLTRTFLPWFGKDSVQPTRVAWLWPLTAKPDRALDGVQLNEQTAAEMADGGRLARLLETVGDAPVTRVFDPALLQTADEMSSGYEVVSTPGVTTTGEGSGVAASWLDDAEQSAVDGPTMTTSYAMPDAVALERADMAETTVLATARATADATLLTQTEIDDVLAWPAGGIVTPGALRSYVRGGAQAILLSDTSLPPSPALTYTPDGFTTWANTQVVLADTGLAAALAMPQDSHADALLARQRFLAELAMTAGELPDDSRSIVAAPDPMWNPRSSFVRQTLRAVREVPYARLVPLETAARRAVEVARVRVPYGPQQRDTELPKSYLASINDQQSAARRFTAILTQPSGLAYEQAVARQTSALWRNDLMTGNTLIDTVSQQLAARTAAVRVATTGTFTLPGDSGRIPVTVANDLDQDVVVGIRLESDEPARLTSEPMEAFEVPAGRKVSQEVEALVAGSGSLPVKIQLLTPAGKPYGQPVTVQVRTTAYSQAAAYVVSGAFVILAFLLGMNFVRRRHVHRKEHAHE
jgi:hypothetical protein